MQLILAVFKQLMTRKESCVWDKKRMWNLMKPQSVTFCLIVNEFKLCFKNPKTDNNLIKEPI